LAAGKTQLHGAECPRFAQHPQPVIGAELLGGARKVGRVVAERTVQGTAVRQFQQQPQRRPGPRRRIHEGIFSHFFATAMLTKCMTSSDRLDAAKARSRSAVISAIVAVPSQRFKISPALVLSLIIPSGKRSTCAFW